MTDITLDTLLLNESATISFINPNTPIEVRAKCFGIIENTLVKCVGISPSGDPKAYLIRGSVVAIRNEDAKNFIIKNISRNSPNEKQICLVGNPNVGKSTLFNALTGMKQHTGNWTGKTVESAVGHFKTEKYCYSVIDLPGTYSLNPYSSDEAVTCDYIFNSNFDKIIVVCDATNLERGIGLALQTRNLTSNLIICVNFIEEAKTKGVYLNKTKLEDLLGVPVIEISPISKRSVKSFCTMLDEHIDKKQSFNISAEISTNEIIKRAEEIYNECVELKDVKEGLSFADRILTSKKLGYPIMLLLLLFIFWITVKGANYPSKLLMSCFNLLSTHLKNILLAIRLPNTLISMLIDGIFGMTARVISVMLPPMAIFFPLFSILEDLGYLPRVAFNLDKPFAKCQSCGKQALTMCMGFGCNACGVTGARIIASPRERILAIVTNSFVPCNGRFPTIITLSTIFFACFSNKFINGIIPTIITTLVVLLGVFLTFCSTKILSKTLSKGENSTFMLELPPFRKPRFTKIIARSIFDKTLVVLSRAVTTAIPSGLVVWVLSNLFIYDQSALNYITEFLDPCARIFGLDGVILAAFILGSCANEAVMPIMIMTYMSLSVPIELNELDALRELLISNGWTLITAICTIIFTLLHWPCATTLLTIKKETESKKWCFVSALFPTAFGLLICFIIDVLYKILS